MSSASWSPLAVEPGSPVGYTTALAPGVTEPGALRVSGLVAGRARVVLAEGPWPVTPRARLSYRVFPALDEDLATRPSTFVAVDAELDDGTLLSSRGARDHRGFPLTAQGQGASESLYPLQWNHVECDIGALAAERTVVRLLATVEPPGETMVEMWFADVRLDLDPAPRLGNDGRVDVADVVDLVDTRRGTNSSAAFSRGNTIPAAAVPNGFTLVTPMTAWSRDWPYSWSHHDGASGRPALHGVAFAHQPSPWMGDRNQLVVVPSWTDDDGPVTFSHDAETARPHRYDLTLDTGARVAFAPVSHGAVLRLSPPNVGGDAPALRLEFGAVDQDCSFSLDPETGTVRGWVDGGSGLSRGRSRMFVVAALEPIARDGGPGRSSGHGVVVVPSGGATARIATSYLSIEQAGHALEEELGSRCLNEVASQAREEWAQRLGVLALEGARRDQLVSAYGSLYRVNLYPSAHHENVGTAECPRYAHASPVLPAASASTDTTTGAAIRPGRAYVNHGFWDTYRTVWPLYALVYPELAAQLADGFVEQFRSGGWISRWPSPGYVDSMTGTSSDVAFADLAVKGVDLIDPWATYRAGLRNATALPPSPLVGRKDLRDWAYRGFPSSVLHEAVSWAAESALCDAALAAQAESLANADDYTETNAWSYSFPAPHDGAGLAGLHGGPGGLGERLDAYLSTAERADRPGGYGDVIHEMTEARDVRRGQLGLSNQPAHHIPFMYMFAHRPGDASALVRDAVRRLFGGSEIGQGYPGDEDNGEMSAWYLWAITGLYPLQAGTPRYVLTAPAAPKVTWRLPGGDLVIESTVDAGRMFDDAVRIARLEVDGQEHERSWIEHGALVGGVRFAASLTAAASVWATEPDAAPPSVGSDEPGPWRDLTRGGASPLVNDDVGDHVVELGAEPVVVALPQDPIARQAALYTLNCGPEPARAPRAWRVELSSDGETWTVADERADESFDWPWQLRPFAITVSHAESGPRWCRFVPLEPCALAQLEVLS